MNPSVSYHEPDYFYRALQIFVLGFLLCAFGWLRPQLKLLYLGGWATSVLGAGLVVAGLTVRCILLSRPPVSTLYETIVFITGIAVLVALVAEAINKRRIALSLGAFVGALGMFVAGAFELLEQRDTLVELQAVLRTNFWLATHVTSVTIGYAGGLLAGFIAHIYLLGKLFGWKKGSYSFYRNIGRMTYGVLCFAVVFATVGTILGWLTLRGESMWPAVIGHAALNGIAGLPLLFTVGNPHPVLGPTAVGLLGGLSFALVALWLWLRPPTQP